MCSKADTVAFTNPPFLWDTLYFGQIMLPYKI